MNTLRKEMAMQSLRSSLIICVLGLAILLGLLAAPAQAQDGVDTSLVASLAHDAVANGAVFTVTLSAAIVQPVDITVEAGALVVFHNDTDQARQVENLPLNQRVYLPVVAIGEGAALAAPEGPQTASIYWATGPIGPGDAYRRVYDRGGDFPFYVAGVDALAGTIHVTAPPPVPPPDVEGPPSVTPTAITDLAVGNLHTCVLTQFGGVKCWGANDKGQLGNGTLNDSRSPVAVSGLSSGVVSISAGADHTCALTTHGGVKCWGGNWYGQLGDSTRDDRPTPVDVIGLTGGVQSIAAGVSHTCASTAEGGVRCWGKNADGQLGDGTNWLRPTPGDVYNSDRSPLTGVKMVTAGGNHTCALTTAESVLCWGAGDKGQLGTGWVSVYAPIAVRGLASGVVAISAGIDSTCALVAGGYVRCWGLNNFGQLGDGTYDNSNLPVYAARSAQSIAVGDYHACMITATGGVTCWGNNDGGQLGDGTVITGRRPVQVSGLAGGVAGVEAGRFSTCARTSDGAVKCWGRNGSGQLGDGTTDNRPTPVDVLRFAGVAAGSSFNCAQTTLQGTKCWGELPTLGWTAVPTATTVASLGGNGATLAVGSLHACVLTVDGTVNCWGRNGSGQLGNGTATDSTEPVVVTEDGFTPQAYIQAITAGDRHTCALTRTGTVKCWGANESGQLGDGTHTNRAFPVLVNGLTSTVIAIAAGAAHTCALLDAGSVQCWGDNRGGQLGNWSNQASASPVNVQGLAPIAAIAAGGFNTCALTTNRNVQCWGAGAQGQNGDGWNADRWLPVWVLVGYQWPLADVAAISVGALHACALINGGGVKCWGDNDAGALGDGATRDQWVAVDVVTATHPRTLLAGARMVTAGDNQSCAATVAGVKCWGSNMNFRLGADGAVDRSAVPIDVPGL